MFALNVFPSRLSPASWKRTRRYVFLVGNDERHSERYLRGVIELLHGVTLEQFDRDGRQRAVDYVFTSPEGVLGAVEMTAYRDGRAAEWESKLNDNRSISCESPRGWMVRVELTTKLDQLRNRLPAVIAACERNGVTSPAHVPAAEWDKDLQWFMSASLHLSQSAIAAPGTVIVDLPPTAGFPTDGGLDRDLKRLLSDHGVATKLGKLRDHLGVTERHLAIAALDFYKPGLDLIEYLLFAREGLPQYTPPKEFAATHVWITGGGHSVLNWNRQNGWTWRSLPRSDSQ